MELRTFVSNIIFPAAAVAKETAMIRHNSPTKMPPVLPSN